MRRSLIAISVATLALCGTSQSIWAADNPGANTAAPLDEAWRQQLVVGSDDDQRVKTLLTIARRPSSDDGVIVPWLEGNSARLPYPFQLELSRRLFDQDKDGAVRWYVVALARIAYDGARCVDVSAGGAALDALAFSGFGQTIVPYSQSHPKEFLAAIDAVKDDPALFGDGGSPQSLCKRGIVADGKALGIPQKQNADGLKPESDWPAIQKSVRSQLAAMAIQTQAKILHPPAVIAPSNVPDAVLAGTLETKVKVIGNEGRAAIMAMEGGQRGLLLQNFATAQLDDGDAVGARETLALADSIFADAMDYFTRMTRLNSIPLWIRAGDASAAQALVDALPAGLQRIDGLGRYGVGMIQINKVAEARRVLDQIDGMYADPEISAAAASVVAKHGPDARSLAVYHITEALAGMGQFSDALDLAERLPPGNLRASLWAKIAADQCKAKDPTGPTTLKRATAELGSPSSEYPNWMATADKACNDAPTTPRSISYPACERALEVGSKAMTAIQLVDLAQCQGAKNELSEAKRNLLKAFQAINAAIGKSPSGLSQEQVMYLEQIVFTYISWHMFDDAIAASELLEHVDRQLFLWRVVAAEVENKDAESLHRTLAKVTSEMASEDFSVQRSLANLAATLIRAGFIDEAREPLRLAQDMASRGVNGYRSVQSFEQIAIAQALLGDIDGARETLKSGIPRGQEIRWGLLITELMKQGNLAGGLELCAELDAGRCGGWEALIASDEAKAGNLTLAMEIAWKITDPRARADAMLRLLKSVGHP